MRFILYISYKVGSVCVKMLKFAPFIKQFIDKNTLINKKKTSTSIFHETNKYARGIIVSLRDRANTNFVCDFWFVKPQRSPPLGVPFNPHWIYQHSPFGTVAFSYEALLHETYHEVTQRMRSCFWPITIAWNWRVKGRNQPPDFERDLYDLGQDNDGTRRAAELLKCIFEH